MSINAIELAKAALKQKVDPVIPLLEQYDIPDNLIQSVLDKAVQLCATHKEWRPEKIARKTAEYFKLKSK